MDRALKYLIIVLRLLSLGVFALLLQPLHAQQELRWRLFPTPVKSNLRSIHMLSPRHGYLLGTKIFEFKGGEWKLRATPAAPGTLSSFQVIGERELLFSTNDIATNNGQLFHFDRIQWKELRQPLANMITAVKLFKDGTGWCGGIGEIARFDGREWEFFQLPQQRLNRIMDIEAWTHQSAWVLHQSGFLTHIDGMHITPHLFNTPIAAISFLDERHGYALGKGVLYEWKDGRWGVHSQDSLLQDAKHVSVLPNGSIWAAGLNGMILHWNRERWSSMPSPTTQSLNYIRMDSDTEGWVVGDNGVILQYSRSEPTSKPSLRGGFELKQISRLSMEIDNVYGVGIDDLDNNGLKDIYTVLIFQANRAYMQHYPEPTGFVEEEVKRGLTGVAGGEYEDLITNLDLGVGMADIDNDGDLDVYLCKLAGKNRLLLNNGSGYFRDVSHQDGRGVGGIERSNSVVFGDVDNDGNLDMFVMNEESSNRLYLGHGNGYFTDVTEQAGLRTFCGGMCARFGDLDGDGRLDLVVSNWGTTNKVYRNETREKHHPVFTDVTAQTGIGIEPWAKTNSVCLADINNDGLLDLFLTKRKASNRLYLNQGNFHFTDVTAEAMGLDSMISYGASFFDFDHDGFLDLYVANVGPNVLYRNIGGRRFQQVTTEYGLEFGGYSTGTATGDIDNDGDLDLFVGVFTGGASYLCENTLNDRAFLKLQIDGVLSNRDAIGTKVWLYEPGHAGEKNHLIGYREVYSGSGYASHDAREVHFGVGNRSNIDVVVQFPATQIQITKANIAVGQTLHIQELEGMEVVRARTVQWIERFATNRETHVEAVKLLLVLGIVVLSSLQARRRYLWQKKTQYGVHAGVLLLYFIQNGLFLHENIFLSVISPILTAGTILLVVHLLFERFRVIRIAAVEKQATRDRIARDLHDDIASTLGSALIYLDALKRSRIRRPKKEQSLLKRIQRLLLETEDAIADIVWTVSPKRDRLDDLVARLGQLVSDSCDADGIESEINIDVEENNYVLPEDIRRNLYFIFKEALSNAMKHAAPRRIQFHASLTQSLLTVKLQDDGCGFDLDCEKEGTMGGLQPIDGRDARHGNGLINMENRAHEIQAQFTLATRKNQGTNVQLVFDMIHLNH